MNRKWWHSKVAYQIYPKSFCDSNGDGIGDLRGIIGKLDHLKELGVDIVWISPFYCSPLADEGYDISDYYGIDPVFGTMSDFDELLSEAKKRGLSIVLDLVVNHCSDEHEWFKKACEDPEGPYGKFFYLRKWHVGEPLPTNWRSYFGGSCWEPLPGHDDYLYLHVFHKKQPDLNWENPLLREEIYRMMNWWLDKGVAGFRIDAIINIKKAFPFKNYPVDRADGLSSLDHMLEEAQGIDIFLNEMADRTFRPHNAFAVGEVFNEKPDQLPEIIGDNGYFSTMFDFAEHMLNADPAGLHRSKPVTAEQYKAACFASQKKAEGIGLLANIIENHDEPRGVSHYIPAGDCTDRSKKMLGAVNFMLKGLPFIFQGQEIGMENIEFHDISEVDDCSTIDGYRVAIEDGLTPEEALRRIGHFSRDNARTPVQWSAGKNAGFTAGTPWLRVNPNYTKINLDAQRGNRDSVYEWYRSLIQLRKHPDYLETLIYGETVPYLPEQKNLMAYFRRGEKELLVLANFQNKPADVRLPGKVKAVLLNNTDSFSTDDGVLHMEDYQFVLCEMVS